MHQIPNDMEQVLRAHGLDDTQIDELRRTGRIEGADDAGHTTTIQVQSTNGSDGTVTLDGDAISTELPPEALEKLRRFHKLMPAGTVDQLEHATGQDIDGDGRIGHDPDPALKAHAVTVTGTGATPDKPVEMLEGATGARIPTGEHRTSGAMPDQGAGGPFVQKRSAGSLLPLVLGVVVLLGLLAYILGR